MLTCDTGFRDALGCLVTHGLDRGVIVGSSPAPVDAAGLGDRDAFGLALADHLALGLGHRGDDVQDQARGEVAAVGPDREALGVELIGEWRASGGGAWR
jgi:hypothetical protein